MGFLLWGLAMFVAGALTGGTIMFYIAQAGKNLADAEAARERADE